MNTTTIKINFRGGIISPGDLYNILVAAGKAGVRYVSFGLRQQLLMNINDTDAALVQAELDKLQVHFQTNNDTYPNIVSSYPAEEVFITNNWLSEGVYKDIFDSIEYTPELKINICDNNQSFTPLLTGNINWVASAHQHFWHLFIRFPRTNIICEWDMLTYTNDIGRLSKEIEQIILQEPQLFIGNELVTNENLFTQLKQEHFILKPAEGKAVLPAFNLPYYEGLNRYNNHYWLGIYRRDELFSVSLLKDICKLSLQTKIGQLCSTPWKSLIIKGIEEKDRHQWNRLLDTHLINVRHPLNELNFQVEDNCSAGLKLKQYLSSKLNKDDLRTFGLCIGIKTRRKSEVFSSLLVRRRPLLRIGTWEYFFVYDILCAKDFNPNERTGFTFSRSNPKFLIAEQLRRAIHLFYRQQEKAKVAPVNETGKTSIISIKKIIYQCKHCLTVYDEQTGEPGNGIEPGTSFAHLPENYCCPLCEAPKGDFVKRESKQVPNDK